MHRSALSLLLFTLLSGTAYAQDIPLQNINETDFKNVVNEFSANFNHTSVSGASTLGKIFGFEIGLVGGMTNTPEVDKLVKRADASKSLDSLPHAEILGVLSVPAGITVEAGLVPKVGSDEFKFSLFAAAVKWTPTEILWDLPVSLAVKGQLTKTKTEFSQTISGVPTDFTFDDQMMGLMFLVSKNFMLVEPYFGIGFMNAKGDLSVTGSTTVFDNTYTASQSASEKVSTTAWMVGAELKLLFFKAGLEYANHFETSRYTGKLSFFF